MRNLVRRLERLEQFRQVKETACVAYEGADGKIYPTEPGKQLANRYMMVGRAPYLTPGEAWRYPTAEEWFRYYAPGVDGGSLAWPKARSHLR